MTAWPKMLAIYWSCDGSRVEAVFTLPRSACTIEAKLTIRKESHEHTK